MLSFRRFNQIKKYLHYCNEETSITDRTHADYDKLYKVRLLVDTLKKKFQSEFSPSNDISVDECMIPFRGRWGSRAYDASKPIKWGVKVWMACCATSGYAYNLDIYCGKDKDFVDLSNVNTSAAVVIKLVQRLWDKGYHIYTDRYYTSPYLLHWLRSVGLSGTGTCMTNRKNFPKEIIKSGSDARHLEPGNTEWLQCHNTGIVATRWTDKKPIYFLSNGLVAQSAQPLSVSRRNKQGDKLAVPAPPTVVAYNQFMGGVDHNDKMAKLDKSRKSYKWYTRIDRKCAHWALYNSYVLYKTNPHTTKPMEFRDFALNVLTSLVGDVSYRRDKGEKRASNVTGPARQEARFSVNLGHYPVFPETGSTDHRCEVCLKKHNLEKQQNPAKPYRDYVNKSVKTGIFCSGCKVYLCVKRGATCFTDYHTKVQYWR